MAERTGSLGTLNQAGAPPNQDQRRFGLDTSTRIIFQEFANFQFIARLMLANRKRTVPSYKFKSFEQTRPTHSGTLTGSNASGTGGALGPTTTYVNITNAVQFLVAGDMLYIPADQANNTATIANQLQGEWLRVVQVEPNSVANLVQVSRNGGTGGTGFVTTTGTNTLTWYSADVTLAEGQSAPGVKVTSTSTFFNYVERTSRTWSWTDHVDKEVIYGEPDNVREAKQARRAFVLSLSRKLLFQHRGTDTPDYVDGLPLYKTGGVLWALAFSGTDCLPGAVGYSAANDLVTGTAAIGSRSRIWKVGNLSDSSLWSRNVFLGACRHFGMFGNLKKKVVVAGGGFMAEFQTLFADTYRMSPGTNEFGMKVTTFDHPFGPPLEILRDETMEQTGHSNDAFILDPEYLEIAVINDVTIKDEIQANDAHVHKSEIYADMGLGINFFNAHSMINIGQTAN